MSGPTESEEPTGPEGLPSSRGATRSTVAPQVTDCTETVLRIFEFLRNCCCAEVKSRRASSWVSAAKMFTQTIT